MMDFTLSNCKDLDVRKVTCGITKRFAILLVMMVMITSKALAGASFEVIDGFKYILDSGTKTATLLPNTEKYAGDVVIPESVKAKDGNDYKVTAFGDKCFLWCEKLTSITIPSSVTSLGDECFSVCRGLTSIAIPSSVTSLGENCFMCSFNLKSIYFKGMDPKYLSEAFIPTTCRIYVLDEYLVDYKYALGTDYMYIYTWNPKE